ncbi:MAG: efflux RND transporter permease subunit, partial [Lachnospiraceae bacterium]|nr:efflux RND transporter permease subunit [Lachnospiraceae bacterium]
PDDVKDAIDNPKKLKALQDLLKQQGQKDAAKQLTVKNLEQLYNIAEVRIPQIESELSNLKMQIITAKGARDAVKSQISKATDNYEQVESGKLTAAVAFGSGSAQLSSAKTTLESSKKDIKEAKKSYEQSRKEALKNANLDQLLTIETLSQLMQAENFSMPAGYINDDKTQYLLKIDEKDESDKDVADTLLTHIDKVGDIRLKDVAEITVIDNSDEIYARVNDENAIVLSVYKSSSAGTATVANKVTEKFEKLKKSDSKLHIVSLMNQGDYIGFIIDSVLSNLLWGALFAIVVLFFFLKDIKPTIVVAFSIPLSVLFAILAMYATNITMNMISLSGLALGIGMLVDNSIVVIENIYRLRNKGISAARAAVMGANQVAGAIFASTLTTICVFLPIVFTDGLTKQLILDMSLTISYSLLASLLVALTVVPCMGATLLKNTKEKKHRFFDALINGYDKVLRLCLKYKFVPILIAVGLLAFCVVKAVNTGIVIFPEMGSNQMSVSLETNPELENKEAFAMLDDISDEIKKIKGVETVGATQNSSLGVAGMGGDSPNAYSIMILLDEEYASKNKEIAKDIEKILETRDLDDYEVSESNMDMSAMMGSGLSVNVFGENEEELLKISDDLMKMISKINGFEEISNGQENADKQVVLDINKDKAMKKNLTVAQIFMSLTEALKTDGDATSVTVDGDKLNVNIKDERDELTLDNLLDY